MLSSFTSLDGNLINISALFGYPCMVKVFPSYKSCSIAATYFGFCGNQRSAAPLPAQNFKYVAAILEILELGNPDDVPLVRAIQTKVYIYSSYIIFKVFSAKHNCHVCCPLSRNCIDKTTFKRS